MLTELRIANFAVFEQLSLDFRSGFTVFTGETGAGKSLLIDAIALLVGGRASADHIRFGAEEAQLEAAFHMPDQHPVVSRLRSQDLLRAHDKELIIRRVIARSGRNRVYLNGTMIPVHILEEFGGTLVDIHGQHDQQSLLSGATQLNVLDSFGELQNLRAEYEVSFAEWKRACRQREDLAAEIALERQQQDFLTFQAQELAQAALRAGEEEDLQRDRRRLGASRRLGELTADVQERLQADGQSVLANLAAIERALSEAMLLDPETAETGRLASEAKVLLKEAASRLRDYRERLETDPDRLTALEDRLAIIQHMKKKYGGTVEAAVERQHRIQADLARIQDAGAGLDACDRRIMEQRNRVATTARRLSAKRAQAARRMTAAVRQELDALRMKQTELSIQLHTQDREEAYGGDGADRAEFLLSANRGEPLKPLSRVASGGELSRVMLALKTVLADVDQVPVLVFDEIDTGVGGASAAAIGKRLRALGRLHQVFCVTHLPQVASQAQHHLCVEKTTGKERTITSVRLLSGAHRESEIARMLGGETVTKKVRETAAELIAQANN